jgi:inosose dehydratase
MNVTIGSAPNSWGIEFAEDPNQVPWPRFLDEVAEAGYEWIELGPPGYLPTDYATLRAELDQRKLKVCGTWVMRDYEDTSQWPSIEAEVLAKGELLVALRAKFLVFIDDIYTDRKTSRQRLPPVLDDAGWQRLIEATHRFADLIRERFELQLAFHPHADSHVENEDQIEALLAQTDPERVALCLDIGHFAYRGGDPIEFIRRHHRRIPYMHFKNIDPDIRHRVEAENIPFAEAVSMNMFCEPAYGVIDYVALRDVLREVDYSGWAIVEQDMYPAPPEKPLPIAKRTRTYLRELGIG